MYPQAAQCPRLDFAKIGTLPPKIKHKKSYAKLIKPVFMKDIY